MHFQGDDEEDLLQSLLQLTTIDLLLISGRNVLVLGNNGHGN